ncbi:MAG TPA: response regulator transcription factor [Burkholderiaceae bacterium]|nr:response regulator transcription factor [Burkholderiaceae bacterium]
MSEGTIKMLLVDDHAVVRAGYRQLFNRHHRIEVIGEAGDAQAAYRAFCELAPDVVVMDIVLPGASGIEALRRILARDPEARVLIFSMHEDAIFPARSLQAGARGYVSKSSGLDVLVEAVLAIARGERYLSHDVAQALALRVQAPEPGKAVALSSRAFEVLRLLADGATVPDIAARLLLSEKTVANYQSILRQRFGASNNIQLSQKAALLGLLPASAAGGGATKHDADGASSRAEAKRNRR